MTLLVTDPLYLAHRTEGHVERPERVEAILRRFEERGLLSRLTPLAARDATRAEIAKVHDRRHIELVHETARHGGGWFDADTYLNAMSYDAAVRAVGGVLAAVEAVRDGKDRTALCLVRPPGHHATSDVAMGFCLFNNVAVAARFLERRVMVIDWDVHHGNGTQDIFWDDPRVLYLSTHRSPFYPGTGSASERGAGNIVNIPVEDGTSREEFMRRFTEGVEGAAAAFKPEFVLVSCGFDAYARDPIGGLGLEPEDYGAMTRVARGLGRPLVSALEGGYDLEGLGLCAEQHALALLE